MTQDHVDKGRAAGRRAFFAVLKGFVPFRCFRRRGQIAAEADFDVIFKAHFLRSLPPAGHRDVLAVLTFHGRRDHQINRRIALERLDHRHDRRLRRDGAEGAGVDALAAADTFFFIDDRKTVFIVSQRAHRAGVFTRADQMRDRVVRAGLRAHPAFTAFVRVDSRALFTGVNRTETAGP